MRNLQKFTNRWPQSSMPSTYFFDELDRMMDSFWRSPWDHHEAESSVFNPSCDIQENQDNYVIGFDMPGVKKEDIHVEVKENILTVSGERRSQWEEKDESTLRRERSYGQFHRSFRLPSHINGDRVEAHYEDGVLQVLLPKTAEAQSRQVEVQSGKGGFFDRLLSQKKDKDLKEVKVSSSNH